METSTAIKNLVNQSEIIQENLPKRVQFRVDEILEISEMKFRIMSITKAGILIRPEGGYILLPGRIRDQQHHRHK